MLASSQAGYFTAADAKALGYSYSAQAYHVHVRNWERIERGIFRLSDWVPDLHDDLVRWTLWSRNRAVVSHETALGVHQVGELEARRMHLTAPPGFRMRDSAVTLHQGELLDGDVAEHSGFKITTVARSLIDVAAESPDEEQLARAIQEARDRGMVTPRQLRSRSEAVSTSAALHIERALGRLAAR